MRNASIIYSPWIVKAVNFMIQVPWVVTLPADVHCCRTFCSEGLLPARGWLLPFSLGSPKRSKGTNPDRLQRFVQSM